MWKTKTILEFKMQLTDVCCHLNYCDLCSSFKYIGGCCCSCHNTPDYPDKSNSINIKLSIVSLTMMNLCNRIPINKVYSYKTFKPK